MELFVLNYGSILPTRPILEQELTDEHGVFNIDEAHLYVIGNLVEDRETLPRVGLDRMYEPLGNWRMRRTDFARFARGN
jgi:hypothetical protein